MKSIEYQRVELHSDRNWHDALDGNHYVIPKNKLDDMHKELNRLQKALKYQEKRVEETLSQIQSIDVLTEEQKTVLAYYATEYLQRGIHGVWHDLATAIIALLKRLNEYEKMEAKED